MKAEYRVSFVLELEQGPEADSDRSEAIVNAVGAILASELLTQKERPSESRVAQMGLLGLCTWSDFWHVQASKVGAVR